jgi:chromosome segregation ATPase
MAETQKTVSGLMAKEAELQRNTMTGAGKIYNQMQQLKNIIATARDEDKAGQYNSVLYNLNKQVDALTGSLTKLQIQWGDFSDVMAGNDTLNADLKTVGDAIDKVKYYGLDLTKTNVDEQINQSINNMTNFMATLNPQSQAYSDALAAITKLQDKFVAMGGVLDPNASQSDSIIAKANAGIGALQDQLNALFADSNSQEMQIKTDITAAMDSLKKLNDELKAVEDEYGTTEFTVDIDIKQAEIKIKQLQASIANLSTAAAAADSSDKGGKLHTGGLVTAHSGSLFPNETMVKALKNEFMLRPAATVAFGSDRLAAFNTSLNPDVLKRQERPAQSMTRPQASSQPVVQIYEATPQTYAKITDRFIAGRIKYRDRKLEVGANPYA